MCCTPSRELSSKGRGGTTVLSKCSYSTGWWGVNNGIRSAKTSRIVYLCNTCLVVWCEECECTAFKSVSGHHMPVCTWRAQPDHTRAGNCGPHFCHTMHVHEKLSIRVVKEMVGVTSLQDEGHSQKGLDFRVCPFLDVNLMLVRSQQYLVHSTICSVASCEAY